MTTFALTPDTYHRWRTNEARYNMAAAVKGWNAACVEAAGLLRDGMRHSAQLILDQAATVFWHASDALDDLDLDWSPTDE